MYNRLAGVDTRVAPPPPSLPTTPLYTTLNTLLWRVDAGHS